MLKGEWQCAVRKVRDGRATFSASGFERRGAYARRMRLCALKNLQEMLFLCIFCPYNKFMLYLSFCVRL